jgi:thioredoxin 2
MADTSTITCPNCGTRNRIRSQPEGVPRCAKCKHALPWIVDATAATFDEELRASVPVLVDFWAPWCGPCQMVSPAVAQLANELAGRLKVVKLDIDTAPAIASRYGIQSIPLLALFREGQEVERKVGAVPAAQLRRWLDGALDATATA